jgi:hypothetical protein
MVPKSYPVTGGPEKFELGMRLMDRVGGAHPVTFHTNCPLAVVVKVILTSVQAIELAPETWNIEGRVLTALRVKGVREESYCPEEGTRVFLSYRTDHKQGTIRFFEAKAHEEMGGLVKTLNAKFSTPA